MMNPYKYGFYCLVISFTISPVSPKVDLCPPKLQSLHLLNQFDCLPSLGRLSHVLKDLWVRLLLLRSAQLFSVLHLLYCFDFIKRVWPMNSDYALVVNLHSC